MDFSQIQYTSDSGLDNFLEGKSKTASQRVKVASLSVLANFDRVSEDFLIHRSSKDLWSLQKDDEGYYIERMFETGAKLT